MGAADPITAGQGGSTSLFECNALSLVMRLCRPADLRREFLEQQYRKQCQQVQQSAPVAQSVEHVTRNDDVRGSIPRGGS